ncbi:MAG: ABC transporter ATP-binding protein [Flammeovirgaceae bacterium]|jgi:ABC-2 type transport system ATP-binding protein|nr:ABC transporter ATP-binding protein [Flammeovirgaceae bacterium]
MNLKVSQLSLKKNQRDILKSISFEVSEGDIVGLVGRNGSGKTSLLKLIAGIQKSSIGTILINGSPKEGIDKRFGIFIGGNSLYGELNAKQNIDIIRRYYNLPKDIIPKIINLVSIEEFADRPVKYYSDGIKQRLSIAITCINNPSLVILDEPLNGLDPESAVKIRNLIKHINQTERTTFIISSHSLEEIDKVLNKLLILKDGELIFNEDKQALNSFKLFKAPVSDLQVNKLIEFLKQLSIFYRVNDGFLEVLCRGELSSTMGAYFSELSWTKDDLLSIEQLYLFVNNSIRMTG